MDVSEAKRLKQLEEKNANLKKARPPSELRRDRLSIARSPSCMLFIKPFFDVEA